MMIRLFDQHWTYAFLLEKNAEMYFVHGCCKNINHCDDLFFDELMCGKKFNQIFDFETMCMPSTNRDRYLLFAISQFTRQVSNVKEFVSH